jgi:hypothetical protein
MPARQSAPRWECGAGGHCEKSRLLLHAAVPGNHHLQSAATSMRAGAGEPPAGRPTEVRPVCAVRRVRADKLKNVELKNVFFVLRKLRICAVSA